MCHVMSRVLLWHSIIILYEMCWFLVKISLQDLLDDLATRIEKLEKKLERVLEALKTTEKSTTSKVTLYCVIILV